MAGILRGEIRWADLNPTRGREQADETPLQTLYALSLNPTRGREQAGLRPVLIISQDVFNQRSGTVIAVTLTSQHQRAGFPLTIELKIEDLPKRSWVKISQIRTLSIERIGKLIGKVSAEEVGTVIDGLNEIIGA